MYRKQIKCIDMFVSSFCLRRYEKKQHLILLGNGESFNGSENDTNNRII